MSGRKTDYISRDYAVENMENYPWDTEHDRNSAIHLVRELVPDADVVEVVRCKDCKEYQTNHFWCGFLKTDIDPDEFCSYGERRTE